MGKRSLSLAALGTLVLLLGEGALVKGSFLWEKVDLCNVNGVAVKCDETYYVCDPTDGKCKRLCVDEECVYEKCGTCTANLAGLNHGVCNAGSKCKAFESCQYTGTEYECACDPRQCIGSKPGQISGCEQNLSPACGGTLCDQCGCYAQQPTCL